VIIFLLVYLMPAVLTCIAARDSINDTRGLFAVVYVFWTFVFWPFKWVVKFHHHVVDGDL